MIIEIRYGNQWGVHGVMRTDPAVWLCEKRGMRDFKKILKLSQESDRMHNTNAVPGWKTALLNEQDRIRQQAKEASDTYKRSCNELRRKYDNPGVPYEAKRESLQKMNELLAQRKSVFDKQIKSFTKQMEKTQKMLDYIHGR